MSDPQLVIEIPVLEQMLADVRSAGKKMSSRAIL